jgi:hypothetical protein
MDIIFIPNNVSSQKIVVDTKFTKNISNVIEIPTKEYYPKGKLQTEAEK